MRKMATVVGIVAIPAFFLGACSSDDGGGDDTQAMVDSLMASPGKPDGATEDDAKCVVDKTVDAIGTEKATILFDNIDGSAPDELTLDDYTAFGTALEDCGLAEDLELEE